MRSLLAVTALVVALPTAAHAHTDLVATLPADGDRVDDVERIVLRFATPVEADASHVWIEGDAILRASLGPASHLDGDERAIEVEVPALPRGAYRVGFHVTAADGDVVTGDVGFGLGVPAPAEPPTNGRWLRPALTGGVLVLGLAVVAIAGAGVVANRRPRKELPIT